MRLMLLSMLNAKYIGLIVVTVVLTTAIFNPLFAIPYSQIALGQEAITEGRLPSGEGSDLFSENATAATVQEQQPHQQNATAATVEEQQPQQQNATAATVEEQQPQLSETAIADLARQAAVEIVSYYFAPASTVGWTIDQDIMQE